MSEMVKKSENLEKYLRISEIQRGGERGRTNERPRTDHNTSGPMRGLEN